LRDIIALYYYAVLVLYLIISQYVALYCTAL